MTPQELLPLRGILLLGLIAFLVLYYAKRKGYFSITQNWSEQVPLYWYDIAIGFFIYFGSTTLLSPLIVLKYKATTTSLIELLAYVNFLAFLLIPLLFFFYFKFCKKNSIKHLFKDQNSSSPGYDITIGLLTYLISLPLIFFLSQTLAALVLTIFGTLGPEQIAVRVLKEMIGHPHLLIPMVLIIIFIGPFVEEFLFRLLLQSYLRKKLGTKSAILLSSLGFSLLHFSIQQEVANFILLPVLFGLGLFLGFIYERQRSLFAPLSLHILFNAATTTWLLIQAGNS
ncbi:MAG: CPBP family intramembrane glutamic endopeptidase [Candidatus Algichlamydia australiensis]|nr:CPBP family intramembrane glutamic endopeptidase [Chlamydiales bacterium]